MEFTTTADARARALLARMRETPMRRGALAKRGRLLRKGMATIITGEYVPAVLANRIAFQLVFKFSERDLYGPDVWKAIGRALYDEIQYLKLRIGLADRKIITVLPKLSAEQLGEFLDELSWADRRVARTVLNAAIDAADPLETGRRYMAEYRLVAQKLKTINPALARTLANATFTAGMPLSKALERISRLSDAPPSR